MGCKWIIPYHTHKGSTDSRFRLAACQLDALRKCETEADLDETLDTLPKTLTEMYTQILIKIEPGAHHRVVTMLQLILWSGRNLSTEQMIDALAVRVDETPSFKSENKLFGLTKLLRHCSSFIVLSPRDTTWNRSIEISLAHSSVKEFLVSQTLLLPYSNLFSEIWARGMIAKICVEYLYHVFSRFSTHYWLDRLSYEEFVFFKTALEDWVSHAKVAMNAHPGLVPPVVDLLRLHNASLDCLGAHDGRFIASTPASSLYEHRVVAQEGANPLHAAVFFGLRPVAQQLLLEGEDPNGRTGKGFCNPLCAAVARGDYDTVSMLIEAGADIKAWRSAHGGDALMVASQHGHTQIVQLMLSHGLDICSEDDSKCCGRALTQACLHCHPDIVEILLDHGSNPNSDLNGCTPLLAAIKSINERPESSSDSYLDDRLSIIEKLLKRGADANGPGVIPITMCLQKLLQ